MIRACSIASFCLFASIVHAGTPATSLGEVDLARLFGEADPGTALDEAFYRLRLTARETEFPLERWFRDTHYLYVRDLLDPEHRAPLKDAFEFIRARLDSGERDWRDILNQAPHPEVVAEVAAINERVVQLKRLNKIVVRLAHGKHEAERNQRYGDERYSYHLRAVRNVLKRFGFGPKDSFLGLQLGTAAWLHDIREDTDLTREYLAHLVGREIALFVEGVTNEKKRVGEDAKAYKRRTLRKTARLKGSRILKLADRIANVEEGILRLFLGGPTKVHKYVAEWPAFERALRRPGEADAMWAHLEGLLTDRAYAQDFANRHLARCASRLAPVVRTSSASGDRPGSSASARK